MSTDPLLRDTPGIGEGPDVDLLLAALVTEREGQRHLLAGDRDAARPYMRAAAAAYLASFPIARPRSWGRLIGAVKAAILAGDATDTARAAAGHLGDVADSPPSCYLGALCAVVLGDDPRALALSPAMRSGGEAFGRAADGLDAIARGDSEALERTCAAIEQDFSSRDQHLTGVAIADTARMLIALSRMRSSGKENPSLTL